MWEENKVEMENRAGGQERNIVKENKIFCYDKNTVIVKANKMYIDQ